MLYCTNCREYFQEEDAGTDKELLGEYWGAPAYREYATCPWCGSDQIEEAKRCAVCGGWKPDDLKDFCEGCLTEIYDSIWQIYDDLRTENPEAKTGDILDAMIDAFDEFIEKRTGK